MSNPAPAAVALLAQATARWPNRSKASDGIVPSAAHTKANPTSDHEIGVAGYNHAVDLTHDPAHGCDCGAIFAAMVKSGDRRIKYVIFNKRIWSPARGLRPYTGSNPHTKHMHVSIVDLRSACENTSAWPGVGEAVVYDYIYTIAPNGPALWALTAIARVSGALVRSGNLGDGRVVWVCHKSRPGSFDIVAAGKRLGLTMLSTRRNLGSIDAALVALKAELR